MTSLVGGELFTDYSDHPRKLVTLNLKNSNQQPDATSFFPVGGMLTASSLAWKTSSEKSDAVALQQIKEWRFTYDWSWWYPSGNWPLQQHSGLHCRALVAVSSSIRLTAWFKIQRSGRNGQRDLMAEQSHRDYLPLWLSASSSACHGR